MMTEADIADDGASPLSVLARIRAQRNSPLANQRLPAAVLAALDDSLRESGEAPTPGAYWAGLVGVLQRVLGGGAGAQDETLGAVVYLLAAVFPSAPPALVRAQFDSLAAVLTPLLANAPPPLLRSLTTCLTHALVALPLSFWTSDAACRRTWRMLLLLSADPRPKVRKRAQDGVKLILSKPPTPVTNHPGTAAALEFISNGLDAAKPSRGEDRDAATLHLLAFLSSILPLLFRGASLPPVLAALRNLLKKVLALPSVSPDGSTATSVLSVFASLFSTDDSHDLDPELLAEFVRSLLENLKPNERDVGLAPIWLEVVAQGFARLAHVITRAENGSDYVEAYSAVLGGFFATAFDGFLSQPVKPAITNAATQSLALVLAEALGPVVSPPHPALAQLISKICSSLGSIKFQKNMGALLRLLAPLYDSLAGSPALSVLLDGSLPTLIGFRDAMDHNPEFTAREELELCLESVVRSAGIQTVISYAPLNIRKEEQGPGSPPRAYLLTTFRRALEGRSETRFGPDGLSLIIGTLLPLASDEFKLSLAATNPVVKKLHGTLAGQIWALLPGLARTAPMDVAEYFGKLMMNWGKILRRQSDLPDVEEAEECLGLVCEALAGLVEAQLRVKENGSEDAQQKADENLRAIGKQGNKILTVLCGLFTELPPSGAKPDEKTERERNRIRSAIAAFLRIANGADVTAYFASLVMGVAKASVEGKPEARYTSLELLGILLPHLPELDAQEKPTLDAYLRLLATEVKDADAGVQKRAYRGLQAAALRMGGERVEAVLRGLVQEDIAGAVVSQARKARLGCLASLVKALPEGNTQLLVELVPEVLPEAISGTKEAGEKARQAGFECLLEMGRRVVQQAGVKEYFAMVSAGLASAEAKMQSASVACLSRLLFEFSDMMDQQLVGDVVDAALFAAESRNRELAKAGLGFIKVAVVTLPQELLENHLDRIIQALLVHSREHASHFKEKTRHIFERLIRRFSYEAVEGFVPEEDRKLLSNIRKRKERAKRRKSAAEADEEDEAPIERPSRSRTYEEVMADTDESDASSEEEDDGKFNAAGKMKRGSKSATYIREDADVLDLLDPKLVSKVVTAKPRRRTARDREEDFERADDGRMIVEDESEEEREREKKRMRGGDVEMADAGDNQDYYTEAITGESAFERNEGGRVKFGSGKKRGRAAESFDEDMEGTASGKKQGWTEAQQRAFNMKHGAKKAKLLDDPDVARMLGKQYKAKKAAGDVKRPDMPDPHAYIPLSSKIVGNKRKGVKAASTFKKIVGAAQRGVKKATQFKVKAGGRGKR